MHNGPTLEMFDSNMLKGGYIATSHIGIGHTLVIKSNSCPIHYSIHKDVSPIKWPGQAEAIAQLNCACKHTACGFVYRSNVANLHILHGL